MTAATAFVTIVAMGVVTYLIRLLPIEFFSRIDIPTWALQSMRYVPIAVLTAIIVPEVIMPGGEFNVSPGNARLLAAGVAIVVAWRTKNVFLTVAAGMAVLWLLQAFILG
ncbi:MAG: AzlD domain-containing protein [Chloroflexi bacterium]|nr:AzlD domain-containing protein [Chloroflexota bacterium]